PCLRPRHRFLLRSLHEEKERQPSGRRDQRGPRRRLQRQRHPLRPRRGEADGACARPPGCRRGALPSSPPRSLRAPLRVPGPLPPRPPPPPPPPPRRPPRPEGGARRAPPLIRPTGGRGGGASTRRGGGARGPLSSRPACC